MRRLGIRVANEAGLHNIITEAQVLKRPSVRASVSASFRSRPPLVLLTQQEL